MSRLKFIVDCLPYAGKPDESRQQGIGSFVASELGIPVQDVGFAEVAIPDPAGTMESVQPGLIVSRDLDLNDVTAHRAFVLRIGAAANAVGLRIMRVVVQQTGSYAGHGAALGTISGIGLGGSASGRDTGSDSAAGLLFGAILGALIGGAIGAAIKRDGPILGLWQRDQTGAWQWTPAEQMLPANRNISPA